MPTIAAEYFPASALPALCPSIECATYLTKEGKDEIRKTQQQQEHEHLHCPTLHVVSK